MWLNLNLDSTKINPTKVKAIGKETSEKPKEALLNCNAINILAKTMFLHLTYPRSIEKIELRYKG